MVAIADTSCNPDEIDYPIPANDDAIRAIKLVCNKIADAVIEGKNEMIAIQPDAEEEALGEGEVAYTNETLVFTPDDQ